MKYFCLLIFLFTSITGILAQGITKNGKSISAGTDFINTNGKIVNITKLNKKGRILNVANLTTTAASAITGTTASSGGNITSDGGAMVINRGVCWNTSPNPTTANSYTSNGAGTGSFTSNLTSLGLGTTYYIRAYATNSVGTAYGDELSFITVGLPTVSTSNASNIKGNSANAGGSITNNGGSSITAQGLCWSTSINPTTSNSITTSFTATMTGLSPNTVYYVRAYATNIAGTGYGNQISFNSGYLIGTSLGGGLVFYNDGNAHGYTCNPNNQSTGTSWGCQGTLIGTSQALNTGASNTNAIVLGCGTAGIAARLCYDLVSSGYSDWYLPSKEELDLMYSNLHTQGLGGFAASTYWSSSESGTSFALGKNFSNGWQSTSGKTSPLYVRAIRNF